MDPSRFRSESICEQASPALGTRSVDTLEGTHNFGQYYPLVIYYLTGILKIRFEVLKTENNGRFRAKIDFGFRVHLSAGCEYRYKWC